MADEGKLAGVLETCLYCAGAEREEAERFYAEVLGLRRVAGWGDGTAFRIGPGMVLLFDRERLVDRDEAIAAHGTSGPGHACFTAPPGEYETWKARVAAAGAEITHEESWPSGRRSFYFSDPAGNLLEISEGDLWPAG